MHTSSTIHPLSKLYDSIFLKIILLTALISLKILTTQAQTNTQQLKGTIIDKTSERPVPGVTVNIVGTTIGTITDSLGRYQLSVPLGRQKVSFSSIGYNNVIIPELLITSGKEVVLDMAIEQNIAALAEVTVRASRTKKGMASNEFAGSSSRSFSMEEVTRYAGGRNDPARLASNFAGVATTDDSRNDIVVRGNSPTGVLWRMEGIPIPNPNHFASFGTTGGPVSALNTNALKTSDFYTGAFPAEFGNASAAVFDISLRPGNKEKFEKTFQLNLFSGLEALIEGPLSAKKDGSSFVVGYRYSFAQIAQSIGLNVGTAAVPRYQDIIFNLDFKKTKAGKFSVFGLAGISNIDFIGADLEPDDLFANGDEDTYVRSRIGIAGLKHTIDIGKQTYLRTVLSYSYTQFGAELYKYYDSLTTRQYVFEQENNQNNVRLSSYINSKLNARLSMRGGFLAEVIGVNAYLKDRRNKPDWELLRDDKSSSLLLQPFIQSKYRFNDKLSLTAGIHGLYYGFNQTSSVEPRASLTYQAGAKSTFTVSYGMHSQLQPLPVYLYQEKLSDGGYDRSNRDLDLTKAHHYVLGYEWRFLPDWRIKAEAYYQYLYNAPVERTPSGFSVLNAGADFGFPEKTQLENKGTGSNTGIEITVERFFSRGFYLLGTASLFDAKYKGSDGVERNSTFNNKMVGNILVGREFKINRAKSNVFTVDIKLARSGGRYYTPVDINASIAANMEKLDENNYNAERLPDYFRTDLRLGVRLNSSKKKLTHTFYLDLQNVTANKNVFTRRYNQVLKTVGTVDQIGFFPDILYRIQF